MDTLIKKAADNLSIVRVNLRSCIINIDDKFFPGVHIPDNLVDLKLTVQRLSKPVRWSEFVDNNKDSDVDIMAFDHLMAARLVFLEENKRKIESEIVLAHIECVFSVIYYLKTKLDDDCLNIFGNNNVEYHVTPYWRNKLQSICTEMNLPIIDVPFYIQQNNMNTKPPKKKIKITKAKAKAKVKTKTKTKARTKSKLKNM